MLAYFVKLELVFKATFVKVPGNISHFFICETTTGAYASVEIHMSLPGRFAYRTIPFSSHLAFHQSFRDTASMSSWKVDRKPAYQISPVPFAMTGLKNLSNEDSIPWKTWCYLGINGGQCEPSNNKTPYDVGLLNVCLLSLANFMDEVEEIHSDLHKFMWIFSRFGYSWELPENCHLPAWVSNGVFLKIAQEMFTKNLDEDELQEYNKEVF